jgi:DNA excision repair protein ERCC-2
MKEIRVSAKEIAEHLFGSGDLTSDRVLNMRAQEGIEIHSYWQNRYLPGDQKEVFVRTRVVDETFDLDITGRIDGILVRNDETVLEEIKSTHLDLATIDETTTPAHLVQAKLYGYLYLSGQAAKKLKIHLTYVKVSDRTFKTIEKLYTFKTLEHFFEKTIGEYIVWLKLLQHHEDTRVKSIAGLKFPFPEFRYGQRELMASVYRTILDRDILYATAPTGIGKTIATVFSGLKAINDHRQKIFYLTAKNDGKRVAIDTVRLLEDNGLVHKTVEITNKDSMCLLKTRDCDPENCKYASGYFKRIFKAIADVYGTESLLTKEKIKEYGRTHRVCPFELSLDLSNYADIIISDYNYAFDPRAHLIRYFEEDNYAPILLIDEAHNLVSRSREMYSATLSKNALENLLELTKGVKPSPRSEINKLLDVMAHLDAELLEVDFIKKEAVDEALLFHANKLLRRLDQAFVGETKIPNKDAITLAYFEIVQFVRISEYYNSEFVFIIERFEKDTLASIKCLNASEFILKTIKEHAISAIFFSATLEPLVYYKSLLTQSEGKDVKFPSSFPQENLLLLVVDDVSTRYNDRANSIDSVVRVAEALVQAKKGNYIVFFPSYQYLQMVKDNWTLPAEEYELIMQRKDMTTKEREDTLEMFHNGSDKTQVGFFVMGGVFGESIDLIGDMLSGVLIVGVGLPMVSPFNNVLRSHFDETFQSGFDFAYTYPGLNKVIQAVGRVIRTETDRGVAILIDDRFGSRRYYSLYPKQWNHLQIENDPEQIAQMIELFWDSDPTTKI